MIIKQSIGEKLFTGSCYLLVAVVCIVSIYPFLYVLAASLSNGNAILANKVILFPVDPTIEAFKHLMSDTRLWISYGNTVYITVGGTFIQLLLTVFAAYPLAKSRLKGRKYFLAMVVVTMFFGGGMIPTFMMFKWLQLTGHRIALMIGINSFFVMVLMTFFRNQPASTEESAQIDGANDFTILSKIVVPLSKPILITLGMYYAVGLWNTYFWAMILLKEDWKKPLQVYLREILIQSQMPPQMMQMLVDSKFLIPENVKYAAIVLSIVPIVSIYPFLQKHYVKGVMIGSIKS